MISALLLAGITFSAGPYRPARAESWLSYGDSKTVAYTWQGGLTNAINVRQYPSLETNWKIGTPTSSGGYLARAGYTVALMEDSIDADVAAVIGSPSVILVNLGANDVLSLPAEAQWNADMGHILDAFHAKWPAARVYVVLPWRRGYDATCDTIAARITALVSTRSEWAAEGIDERTTIKGADDGATNTVDGIHYNDAGSQAAIWAWVSLLGY